MAEEIAKAVGALDEPVVEQLRVPIGLMLAALAQNIGKPPPGTWRRVSFDFVELSDGGVTVTHIRVQRIEEKRN